jgi:hypothetical protein
MGETQASVVPITAALNPRSCEGTPRRIAVTLRHDAARRAGVRYSANQANQSPVTASRRAVSRR